MGKAPTRHFVPRVYLKAWGRKCGDRYDCWVYSKATADWSEEKTDCIMALPGFYTDQWEGRLQKLENRYGNICSRVMNQSRPICRADRPVLVHFLVTQLHRNPARMRTLETLVEVYRADPGKPALVNGRLFSGDDVRKFLNDPMSGLFLPRGNELAQIISKIGVGRIFTHDSFGFITSDNPVGMRGREAAAWLDPFYDSKLELFLPLSPRCCLRLAWDAGPDFDISHQPEKLAWHNRHAFDIAHTQVVAARPDANPRWAAHMHHSGAT